MSFDAGVRVMRAVHAHGTTCQDIPALESVIRELNDARDYEAAAIAYAWYSNECARQGWDDAGPELRAAA
jgi:hypothetical protein